MDLQTIVLEALADFGAIAVFIITLISAMGLPLPASFMLMVAGAFIEQGDLGRWPVALAAVGGAILGDQGGYWVGRLGGRSLAQRLSARLRAEHLLGQADRLSDKYGGPGIFFSRWLVGGLGPYVNLSVGITRYAWWRFTLWDMVGEIVWVLLYIELGALFSEQLSSVADVLGDFTWLIVGLLASLLLLRRLIGEMTQKRIG